MTIALCFNCGATKFGAICPCPKCNVGSCGDMSLDITFSDHIMSRATLEAFGEVIHAIHRECPDDKLRFWSFIRYLAAQHPEILNVNMPPEQLAECEAVLARANPPPVTIDDSERKRFMRHWNGAHDA